MAQSTASITEVVKEAIPILLGGSEEAANLSVLARAHFARHAVLDDDTGELYMGPEQFLNAIAPPDEDYVGRPRRLSLSHRVLTAVR